MATERWRGRAGAAAARVSHMMTDLELSTWSCRRGDNSDSQLSSGRYCILSRSYEFKTLRVTGQARGQARGGRAGHMPV